RSAARDRRPGWPELRREKGLDRSWPCAAPGPVAAGLLDPSGVCAIIITTKAAACCPRMPPEKRGAMSAPETPDDQTIRFDTAPPADDRTIQFGGQPRLADAAEDQTLREALEPTHPTELTLKEKLGTV